MVFGTPSVGEIRTTEEPNFFRLYLEGHGALVSIEIMG